MLFYVIITPQLNYVTTIGQLQGDIFFIEQRISLLSLSLFSFPATHYREKSKRGLTAMTFLRPFLANEITCLVARARKKKY